MGWGLVWVVTFRTFIWGSSSTFIYALISACTSSEYQFTLRLTASQESRCFTLFHSSKEEDKVGGVGGWVGGMGECVVCGLGGNTLFFSFYMVVAKCVVTLFTTKEHIKDLNWWHYHLHVTGDWWVLIRRCTEKFEANTCVGGLVFSCNICTCGINKCHHHCMTNINAFSWVVNVKQWKVQCGINFISHSHMID